MTRFMPAFIFLLAGCGTLSQTSAPVGDRVYLTHATFHENVDDIVQHYMQQKQVPGISIAVIHRSGPTRYYALASPIVCIAIRSRPIPCLRWDR